MIWRILQIHPFTKFYSKDQNYTTCICTKTCELIKLNWLQFFFSLCGVRQKFSSAGSLFFVKSTLWACRIACQRVSKMHTDESELIPLCEWWYWEKERTWGYKQKKIFLNPTFSNSSLTIIREIYSYSHKNIHARQIYTIHSTFEGQQIVLISRVNSSSAEGYFCKIHSIFL